MVIYPAQILICNNTQINKNTNIKDLRSNINNHIRNPTKYITPLYTNIVNEILLTIKSNVRLQE
jgi:hypothetical protein